MNARYTPGGWGDIPMELEPEETDRERRERNKQKRERGGDPKTLVQVQRLQAYPVPEGREIQRSSFVTQRNNERAGKRIFHTSNIPPSNWHANPTASQPIYCMDHERGGRHVTSENEDGDFGGRRFVLVVERKKYIAGKGRVR
jgi:hypothetical protein